MWNGANEVTIDGKVYTIKIQGNDGKAIYTDKYTNNKGTAIEGVLAIGKPTVCGNYLFIAERFFGDIHVYDISYLTDPASTLESAVLVGTLKVDGNPDLIYCDGTTAYVPLGYQGMLVIDTTKAFAASEGA